jgi:hypothetical protein
MIDEVIDLQKEKKKSFIKISSSFGSVVETIKDEENIVYAFFSPNDSDVNNANIHLINLLNNNDINEYKRVVRAQILKMCNQTNLLESKTLFLAIHSMQINTYDVTNYGVKDGISPRAQLLIQKGYAFMYSGNERSYYNICWFSIPVYYEYYKDDIGKIALKSDRDVPSATAKAFKDYYNIKGSGRKELKEYPGFVPLYFREGSHEYEIERFLDYFELPSIQVWHDNEKKNIFEPLYVHKCKKHIELGDKYEDEMINIVIYPSQDENYKEYVVYPTHYKKALKICICPKCKFRVFPKNENNHETREYAEHVKKCDGKRPAKELRVSDYELPYAPGMFNNNSYLFLQAHNILSWWKPDEYFIVYDLETVETPYSKNDENKKTKILSTLSTLSIATCYHTKKGDIVTQHNLIDNGEDFVKNWMRELIKYAKIIYQDNLYIDINTDKVLNIPKRKEVAVLGYNSGRFDVNLIYKKLYKHP